MVYLASKLIENLQLFYKSSSARVLPSSRVGYHAGKPIESVVYCLSIRLYRTIYICDSPSKEVSLVTKEQSSHR